MGNGNEGLCPPASQGTPGHLYPTGHKGQSQEFYRELGHQCWQRPAMTTSDHTGTGSRPEMPNARREAIGQGEGRGKESLVGKGHEEATGKCDD